MRKVIVIILFTLSFILISSGMVLSITGFSGNRANMLNKEEYNKYQPIVHDTIMKYNDIFSNYYPIEDFNDFSDEFKTLFLLKTNLKEDVGEIDVATLEKESSKYFNNFEIIKQDIKINDSLLYSYEDEKYYFVSNIQSNCKVVVKDYSDNAYKDKWISKNKLYFVNKEAIAGKYSVYSTLNDCDNDKKSLFSYNEDEKMSNDDYELIKSKLNTYVYTFNRVSDRYIIKSIKIEK